MVQTVKAQSSLEHYQALFILKFVKYTNWENTPNQFVIGVVGNSPIIPDLKSMSTEKEINGKEVIFEKISTYDNLGRYSLIYIPKSQNSKFSRIQENIRGKSILVVVEDKNYISKGASISFVEQNNSLKFIINKTSITKNKMQISSRLLSVALSVN